MIVQNNEWPKQKVKLNIKIFITQKRFGIFRSEKPAVRHDRESLSDGAEELGRATYVVGYQNGAVAGA
jgi:hypothetical protein